MTRPAHIGIRIEGDHDLTVDQVWPDGDAPEVPTAEDVMTLLAARGLAWGVRDWNLDYTVTITVDAPNPHYAGANTLLPELAPAARIVTTTERRDS